jgi:hypothetical protein
MYDDRCFSSIQYPLLLLVLSSLSKINQYVSVQLFNLSFSFPAGAIYIALLLQSINFCQLHFFNQAIDFPLELFLMMLSSCNQSCQYMFSIHELSSGPAHDDAPNLQSIHALLYMFSIKQFTFCYLPLLLSFLQSINVK